MFLRIAGLVGSVLFLVYLADDYIAANNPNLVATNDAPSEVDEEGQVDLALASPAEVPLAPTIEMAAATTSGVTAGSSEQVALVQPEPTKEIELMPMTVASALTAREIELPPGFDNESASFVITRQLERVGPEAEVTQAALRSDIEPEDDALELREVVPPSVRSQTNRSNSLAINLMVVSAQSAAIHAAPSSQAGIKGVVNAGFVVTAFDVKGSDWLFVQDTTYTLSGYIRASQLKPLVLTN